MMSRANASLETGLWESSRLSVPWNMLCWLYKSICSCRNKTNFGLTKMLN